MQLFMLSWDNQQEYEEHEVTELGYYLSEAERDKAKKRYAGFGKNIWPFTHGDFLEWDTVLGDYRLNLLKQINTAADQRMRTTFTQ